MDIVIVAKRVAGNEWLPYLGIFKCWLNDMVDVIPAFLRPTFEMYLHGMSGKDIADNQGIAVQTVYDRISQIFRILSSLLGQDRSMFRSIKEFRFSSDVDGEELGMCFYGRKTKTVQERWFVRADMLGLPVPEKKGGKYVLSKADAEEWREWFIAKRGG